MAMVKRSFSITGQHDSWVKARVGTGEYATDSEFVRDLIRRDQEQNAKFQALKQAIQEGLDSGVSETTVPQIMDEVEARLKADGRL